MGLVAPQHVGSSWTTRARTRVSPALAGGFFYLFIYFSIYFWLHCVFGAARRLSIVVASRGYSLLQYAGFSLWWLLLLRSTGSRHAGFSSCSTQAQQLWHMGLVALRHVGSSQTRARTRVPYIGRWKGSPGVLVNLLLNLSVLVNLSTKTSECFILFFPLWVHSSILS